MQLSIWLSQLTQPLNFAMLLSKFNLARLEIYGLVPTSADWTLIRRAPNQLGYTP